jgi:hypothetical protein
LRKNGMEDDTSKDKRETILSWVLVAAFAAAMWVWGFMIYFTVGDKGPPPWDYSIIEDVPGEAPYSIYSSQRFHGRVPRPMDEGKVDEQHVSGPPVESRAASPKGNK